MAKSVDGSQATSLRAALIKSGAETKIFTEGSLVSVTNVKCAQEGGIVLLPLKCSFIDKLSGRLEESEGKNAQSLASAMTSAGIKSASIREGEHTSFRVAAKSIECSTMAMHHVNSCEIK
jgi:hypothetical protein